MTPAQRAEQLLEHARRDLVHAEELLERLGPAAGPEVLAADRATELTEELLRGLRAVFL